MQAVGWLLCCVVICLVRPLTERERQEAVAEAFWRNKVWGKSVHDVLLLGDSRTYFGLSPEILETYRPGWSVYNFGFSSGRINRQLLMEASKRLKPDGKRIFVFACTPIDLMDVRNRDFFDKKRNTSSFSGFFAIQIKLRKSFQQISGFEGSVLYPTRGWAAMHQIRPVVSFPKVLQSYTRDFTGRPFSPSDFAAFVDDLRWCREQKIHVIAFRMVSCPEMDDLEDRLSCCDFNKIKQAILDAGFTWLERPPAPMLQAIGDQCYDASHLNESGATSLSHWLGQQLKNLKLP